MAYEPESQSFITRYNKTRTMSCDTYYITAILKTDKENSQVGFANNQVLDNEVEVRVEFINLIVLVSLICLWHGLKSKNVKRALPFCCIDK